MMSSKVVSKLQQQLSKKPISFSRFNAIHNAGSIKSQPMFQPLIQTRMVNTSNKAVLRDTSYPFDWRRKEHEIPELPVGEEMPAQVEASVLGSDIPYMREHIGKIFNFTPAEVTKFFPEGPSSRIIRSLEGFTKGNLGFLVREQSVQAVSYLEKSLAEGFKSPYLFLDGREGSGKSIVLNQAVHWARSNGWLVIFLNNGSDFINGNFFTRSTIFPGMYEQPELGEILLKGFLAAHAEQIKTIPLRTDVEVEGFERKENATLYDLVKFGVEYNESVQSCAVLFYVLRELNLVTEFPVLLAIDGVNYFHQNSRRLHDPMGDEESPHKLGFPRMPGDKLVLANLFRNYKKNNLINGTQIVTMTHFPNYDAKYMENTSLRPDRRNVLNIPPYTKEEFSIISEYYYKTGVTRADLSARSREYIYFLNEGLPGPLLSYMITYN